MGQIDENVDSVESCKTAMASCRNTMRRHLELESNMLQTIVSSLCLHLGWAVFKSTENNKCTIEDRCLLRV